MPTKIMPAKIIRSVVITFIGVAVGVGCGAAVAMAQETEGGAMPPPSEIMVQPAPSMEQIQPAPMMQDTVMIERGGASMPFSPERPNAGPSLEGMPQPGMQQQGGGWIMPMQPQREFRQEKMPYPSSEAEVRARVTEEVTKKITNEMADKIKSQYMRRNIMPPQRMPPGRGEEFNSQGRPFEGGGFQPPAEGQGQPFQGGGEFGPPSQGGGQPFQGGGFDPGGGEFGPPGGGHGGFGGEEGFGGSWGPGPGGEGGESDEAMMEEQQMRFEEQEKMMRKQQLQEMKRGFRGMESGIRQTQKIIDRLIKKGVAVPQEYVTLISEVTQAAATIKNAEEFDENVEAAMEILQEKGPELGDIGPRLGMLEQWPKTLKQAEREIKKLNDALAKAKKKKGVSEYAEIIAKVEARVSDMNSRFAAIKAAGESGDFEEAMGELQDFFESVGDTHREIGILGQISNIAKMIRSGEKEIARFEKQVKKFAKKGIDASSITALIAEARGKISELKTLAKDTEAEPDDFFTIMEALDELRQRATDEFNALQGRGSSQEGAVIRALIQLREGR